MARKTVKKTSRRKRKPSTTEVRRGVDYGITGGLIAGTLLLIYSFFSKNIPQQITETFSSSFAVFTAVLMFATSWALHIAGVNGVFGSEYAKVKKRRLRKYWW